MGFSLLCSVFIFVGIYSFHFSKANEPLCSKFPYEEQLLEKMIRTEVKVEMMVNEIKTTQDNVLSTLGEIKQTVAEFSDKFVDLRKNITEEVLTQGVEIKQKEELFRQRFEETKVNLTNVIDHQRNTLIQLQGNLERPPIAFYAHHVTDLKLDTTNEVIIFDKTFMNEGTGYNTATGVFTAPRDGVYQFTVHVCASDGKYSFIGIVLDGRVIAADVNYGSGLSTCSNVGATIRVKSGQQIWVKSTSSGSTRQLYQNSTRMNTFSGMLVGN